MLFDVLQEHHEEVEILWSRRRAAVWSSDLDLNGLAALEQRLAAHLYGLALGWEDRREATETALHGNDVDAAFVCAAALLVGGESRFDRGLIETLQHGTREARRGIVEALCHLPLHDAAYGVMAVWIDRSPAAFDDGIEVLSFHRRVAPEVLAAHLFATESSTRRAVARALGRVGGKRTWIQRLVQDADHGVRDEALAAAVRCGVPGVLAMLRTCCGDPRQTTPESIRLLACIGDQNDVDIVASSVARQGLGEASLAALGTLGYRDCVDRLMKYVDDPTLRRGVGAAFRRITGLKSPTAELSLESPELEDVDFEDLRPVPDAGGTRELWLKRRSDFGSSLRWRNGNPIVNESWMQAPDRGDLLTRREELTRSWAGGWVGRRMLELDSPADRQMAILT